MELLDEKRWCTTAYEVAAAHYLFTHMLGWRNSKTRTDLLRLPILILRCGSYHDKKWCLHHVGEHDIMFVA